MNKWMIGIVTLTILALVLPGAAVAQGPEGCADTYVVQPGDTLAQIAGQLLDNPWAYPALVFATNRAAASGAGFAVIADPNLIEVGDKLCIPADEGALSTVDVRTFKNLAYLSEFTQKGTAPLVNGEYSESVAPGSATKTVIKLHDRMVFGYTANGQPFAAVILVSDPGGSGTFYHLAYVTLEGGKPQHVASAFLGDRVQIQSLAVEDGEIVVEMIAHGDDDPMCCPTQYTVARYALQGDELVQTSVEAEGKTSGLLGVVWEWERFVGGDDSVIEVDEPSKYTLTLNADGTYQVVADCNRAGGGYTLEGSLVTLLPGPMTLAECGPDSLYDEFVAKLGDVRTYVRPDQGDQLVLNLFADAGNMFFRPAVQATMERSLEGTSWKLVSYDDGSGALVSVLDDTEITADLVKGELTGSAGCNNYFASYELDGQALTIGPAGATRKMCGAPEGIMEQEQAYLSILESVTGYRSQGSQLELLGTEGAALATFVVQEPTK